MSRKYLKILILINLTLVGYSQGGFNRQYFISGSATSISRNVIEAPNGNLIIIGLTLENQNAQSLYKVTVVTTNSTGDVFWKKSYGDVGHLYINDLGSGAVLQETDGFYHALPLRDTCDNGAFIKFNYDGDTLWQRIYRPAPFETVYPMGIGKSVDGGFLITGIVEYNGTTPSETCLVIKTDHNGYEQWRKKISKPAPNVSSGKAIVQDSATKKIIIVGYQNIGNDPCSNILFLDSLGNKIYQTTYDNGGGGFTDVKQLRDKNFITCGSWRASTYQVVGTAVKFNINGSKIWQKNFNIPSTYNGLAFAQELSNGDLLFAGYLDTMQVPPQFLYPELICVHLTCTDKNGNLKWEKDVGLAHQTNVEEGAFSLNRTHDGGFIIAVDYPYLNGVHPYGLIKIDSTGCDSTQEYCASLMTGVSQLTGPRAQFRMFPNPANSFVTVAHENATGEEIIVITDIFGREILRKQVSPAGQTKVPLNGISAGAYIMSVENNGRLIKAEKLVVAGE